MSPRHVAMIAAIALTTGCLLKDTTETWYLSANGAVTWIVTETDVRSDAQAAADRQAEEDAYRLAFERQDHPAARGLRGLGLTDIRTFVLRRDVPFTVRTEARGVGIGELGLRIIQRAGLAGNSTLVRDGDAWVWSLSARDPHAPDVTTPVDEDVAAVLSELEHLKVVLVGGRFETAEGFELSADKRVATFIDPTGRENAPGADDSVITLRLRWIAG